MTDRSDRRTEAGILAAAVAAVVVALAGALLGTSLLTSAVAERTVAGLPSGPAESAVTPVVTAPLAEGGAPFPSSAPTALDIPALGIGSATVVDLGRTPTGTMEVPGSAGVLGWYATNPAPGEPGAAVIAGHTLFAHSYGVFHRLRDLVPGDEVRVSRADGKTAEFTVERVETRQGPLTPGDVAPDRTSRAELRLVTCGGLYDDAPDDAVTVVTAALAPDRLAK
ncbi:sortase domain-containing protein [Amycolatopsis minnesotensis]|uniref:Sortase family protein n=1 Tax=Amycolatopsis minnesotensis TaxID=337894 RepID=A0ABP5BHF7_9PSEU